MSQRNRPKFHLIWKFVEMTVNNDMLVSNQVCHSVGQVLAKKQVGCYPQSASSLTSDSCITEGRQSPRSLEVEPLEVSEIFQISEFQRSNELRVLPSTARCQFSEEEFGDKCDIHDSYSAMD